MAFPADYRRVDRAKAKLYKALELLQEAEKDCDPAISDKAACVGEIAKMSASYLQEAINNSLHY